MNLIKNIFLIFSLLISIANSNEVHVVNIPIPNGTGIIKKIEHKQNTTEITISGTNCSIHTGGYAVFKLNQKIFNYFILKGKKYFYTGNKDKRMNFGGRDVTLVFEKLRENKFDLTECEKNGCWNIYNVYRL